MANKKFGTPMKSKEISADKLRELFDYSSSEGLFRWKVQVSNKKIGTVAGRITNGYRSIRINEVDHYTHRLIWLWETGKLPENKLAFQDGNTLNCRFVNLIEQMGLQGHDHSTVKGNAKYHHEKRKAYPRQYAEQDLRKNFGITLSDYSAMVVEQHGCCAICDQHETEERLGKVRALSVDHNHETGKVRGLLCIACNKMIGIAKENEDILISAIKYLQKHNGTRKTFVPVIVKNEPSAG